MRGKADLRDDRLLLQGITPAYAGKRRAKNTSKKPSGDHPRVCGEKQSPLFQSPLFLGSPPRMRGKVSHARNGSRHTDGSPPRMRGKGIQQCYARVTVGITPAYAGKSSFTSVELFSTWDHPRVCGEKCVPTVLSSRVQGSPPRMRGKVFFGFTGGPSARITPAYAGKRRSSRTWLNFSRDHPRVCGEKRND